MRGSKEEKTKLLPTAHPLAISDAATYSSSPSSHNVILTLLTLSAGIGGFLFGYDTGVISGALPFMRDDLLRDYKSNHHLINFLEELIVSSAILGAACGAAMGGWISDRFGRKRALSTADLLFSLGALCMALTNSVHVLLLGRVVVGLGVGLASVTVPVYIAECSPASHRASLVTVNVLMITTGQLVSYVVNYCFTYVPGTWRWMLGVAGIPSVLQLLALLFLPESPKWLELTGNRKQAQKARTQLLSAKEAEEAEMESSDPQQNKSRYAEKSLVQLVCQFPEVRLQLSTGIGLQALQQLCGINTVMYYTPTILEIAGFVDKRQALFLSILPAFVNSFGTLIGMWCIDRYGRRKLLLGSLAAVCGALLLSGFAFHLGERASGHVVSSIPGSDVTSSCPAVNCHDCLNTGIGKDSCSFCAAAGQSRGSEGVCVHAHDAEQLCSPSEVFTVYDSGCPSPYQTWLVSFLILYLLCFAPGLGPVPWAINAEIYPAEVRGVAGGAAATTNWLTNFLVSQSFLTIAESLGISGVFCIYACVAFVGFGLVCIYLPETKGLSFEDIQRMYRSKVAPQTPG